MPNQKRQQNLLEVLRIDEAPDVDAIPTSGVLIYETMDGESTHSIWVASSNGSSMFHILGLLEAAVDLCKMSIREAEQNE